MKFSYDLYGGPAHIKEVPVIGATMNKNTVVHELRTVPTEEEAKQILAKMDAEMKRRNKETAARIRAEKQVNRE